MSSTREAYEATSEAVEYFKYFGDRYRFLVAVDVAALLFVFNQGAQDSFYPTSPTTFLVSLAILILSLFLSFAGYSGMTGMVSRLLRCRAVGGAWTFEMGWRDSPNRWLFATAALLTNMGVVGLVAHYFFQWFGKNQLALGG